MTTSVSTLVLPWLTSIAAVFFIVDPFAATPTFLAITAGYERSRRKQVARRAALTCLVFLSVFATIGKYVFRLFGITIPAFKLGGGLLLLLVALDMLQARRSRTRETPEEQSDACTHTDDVGIIPMGIPMLAGPGSLSTVMVLVGQGRSWKDAIPVLLGIAITSGVAYIVLASADRVGAFLGDIGIRVLTRLMGLMLTAIAFQFFVSALADMHLIAPVPMP
jgi:multiple antibiotic resistance protein